MKFGQLVRVDPKIMEQNNQLWKKQQQARHALEHKGETKAMILQEVNDYPGSSAKEIYRRHPNMTMGAISGGLWKQSSLGEIKKVKQDGFMRYYPANYLIGSTTKNIGSVSEEIKKVKRMKVQGRYALPLYNAIKDHPGITPKEIGRSLSWIKSQTRYSLLSRWVTSGRIIRVAGFGNENNRYYLPGDEIPKEIEKALPDEIDQDTSVVETEEPKRVTFDEIKMVEKEPLKAFLGEQIEQKAKDYVWEASPGPSEVTALRIFVKWVKEAEDGN